jgi:hypothetical protein
MIEYQEGYYLLGDYAWKSLEWTQSSKVIPEVVDIINQTNIV